MYIRLPDVEDPKVDEGGEVSNIAYGYREHASVGGVGGWGVKRGNTKQGYK